MASVSRITWVVTIVELSQPPSVVERVRSGRRNLHIAITTDRKGIYTLDLETTIIVGTQVDWMKEEYGATRQTNMIDVTNVISAHGRSLALLVRY